MQQNTILYDSRKDGTYPLCRHAESCKGESLKFNIWKFTSQSYLIMITNRLEFKGSTYVSYLTIQNYLD